MKVCVLFDNLHYRTHKQEYHFIIKESKKWLKYIHSFLIKAQSEGKSFETWKKDITPTLAKKGWLGKVEVINDKTGEIKKINVNNARLRRIYNINMRSANAQGRA
ncbi:MAG: hypothetical protein K2I63_00105, partial [Helicobacter sp.]|nr:hypothetical protein [Helicobacter sp.]